MSVAPRGLCLGVLLLAVPAAAAETMRIAMAAPAASVTIEGAQLAWGADSDDAEYVPLALRRVDVRLADGKLTVDGAPLPIAAVRFRDTSGAPLLANGVRVRGDVVVLPQKRALLAVNVLPLEDYLEGVIGSEMPKSFPPEALKAQAIAARTYALHRKLSQLERPYYVESSVISQVYRGLAAADPRTREAVEATRGQVLTFQLQPIEAYFHASCGGTTESGQDALGREQPYLKPVQCPCGRLASSHWHLELRAAELGAAPGAKAALAVEERTRTGRARRVQLGGRSLDAVRLRERLGYMRLKSLAFEVTPTKGGVAVEGRGFGHGAGLCQWGARLLAEDGWGAERILAHYYPGAELQTLY